MYNGAFDTCEEAEKFEENYNRLIQLDKEALNSFEKEALNYKHPCKVCEVGNCKYKDWYNNHCKDMNDYLRNAINRKTEE